LPPIQDDYDYPDAEAFPTREERARQSSSEPLEESSTSSIVAPARRTRTRKALPVDNRTEVSTAVQREWVNDYSRTMEVGRQVKENMRTMKLATVNAEFWVVGNGLNGIGRAVGMGRIPQGLQMFAGDSLLEALAAFQLVPAGQKRGREEEEAEKTPYTSENRRVRPRTEDDEVGRGGLNVQMDNDHVNMGSPNDYSPIDNDDVSNLPWYQHHY
jgi:hypothetical protein